MTYKVILVDDESLILKSLQKIINWQAINCEVAGTANDGQDAVSLIKDIQPEIVITDICMPEMNGLELLKRVQTFESKPEVILLSGYNDFKYVKEGLQHNAFDYILKPIDHEELEKCLRRVIIKYEGEQNKKYEYRKHGIYEALTLGSTKKDGQTYVIVKLEFNKPSDSVEQHLKGWVDQEVKERFTDVFFYKFDRTSYVLVYTHYKEDVTLDHKVKSTMRELSDQIGILVKIAIGKEVKGINNLYLSYQQTCKLLESASFLKMKLVSEGDIKNEIHSQYSQDAAIQKAKLYMQENFTKEIGIESVAEEVDFSVSYFSVLFKQKTGVTFLDYLTNLRIEHACVLLNTTDLKNYEIAHMVGYSDQRYFSQVFKKRLSVTPSQYRRGN